MLLKENTQYQVLLNELRNPKNVSKNVKRLKEEKNKIEEDYYSTDYRYVREYKEYEIWKFLKEYFPPEDYNYEIPKEKVQKIEKLQTETLKKIGFNEVKQENSYNYRPNFLIFYIDDEINKGILFLSDFVFKQWKRTPELKNIEPTYIESGEVYEDFIAWYNISDVNYNEEELYSLNILLDKLKGEENELN